MTLDDFIMKLAISGRTWQLEPYGSHAQLIRSPEGRCPISAITFDAGRDQGKLSYGGRFLGLDGRDSLIISASADETILAYHYDSAIRQRLLEACNLVMPEISSVEQVNACELECAT